MLSVDEARARIVAAGRRRPATPTALRQAAGLVLGADVVARRDLPGFDNSAMDGFALRAGDVASASSGRPVRLRLLGEVAAGAVFGGRVETGGAVRIMTGAPLPKGADAVLEVEETAMDADGVLALRAVERGRSIRRVGEDIRRGEVALAAGSFLGPAQLGLLAALGEAAPVCIPRPRVALLATGDELVDVEVEPGPGQVVDIGVAFAAAAVGAGAEVVPVLRAADAREDLERALRQAAEADVVVSVGGVSMGEYDLVRKVVEKLGALDFWKVAIRPGKPLAVGRVLDRSFVGLPGNPVSALVGFEVFVLPLLLAMGGRDGWSRPSLDAELATGLSTPPGLRTFARARLQARRGSTPLAHPVAQGSHQLHALANSDALLDIGEEAGALPAGAAVKAILVNHPPLPPLAG